MAWLRGLLFGMTLQLAVGPVFLAVLDKSVKEGYGEAAKMILGVALVDALYIAVSFTGIGSLLRIDFLRRIIEWGGAVVLIGFGLRYFRQSSGGGGGAQASGGSLRYGIKLTLTNPLTVLFWAGAFGTLIASGKLVGWDNILLYALGCVGATLFFLSIMAWFGRAVLGLLHPRAIRWLDYLVGTFLIGFGVSMFWR